MVGNHFKRRLKYTARRVPFETTNLQLIRRRKTRKEKAYAYTGVHAQAQRSIGTQPEKVCGAQKGCGRLKNSKGKSRTTLWFVRLR